MFVGEFTGQATACGKVIPWYRRLLLIFVGRCWLLLINVNSG